MAEAGVADKRLETKRAAPRYAYAEKACRLAYGLAGALET